MCKYPFHRKVISLWPPLLDLNSKVIGFYLWNGEIWRAMLQSFTSNVCLSKTGRYPLEDSVWCTWKHVNMTFMCGNTILAALRGFKNGHLNFIQGKRCCPLTKEAAYEYLWIIIISWCTFRIQNTWSDGITLSTFCLELIPPHAGFLGGAG